MGLLALGRGFGRRPALGVLIGAFAIAFSGILYRKANVSPSTGAFFRCLWALPPPRPLAVWEDRRIGARPRRSHALACARRRVLRGRPDPLAPLDRTGRRRTRDRPRQHPGRARRPARLGALRRTALARLARPIPVALAGDRPDLRHPRHGAYGGDPPLGAILGILTAIAYSGFLLTLRRGQRTTPRARRAALRRHAPSAAVVHRSDRAPHRRELDFTPGRRLTAWLIVLALSSQVLGWLLISISLPRLPAVVTSHPADAPTGCSWCCSAAVIVDESPSVPQLHGCRADPGRPRARHRATARPGADSPPRSRPRPWQPQCLPRRGGSSPLGPEHPGVVAHHAGIAVPSRLITSTSTSGPPIMKSVWTGEML